ncbi:hypothetical protein AXG93_424s1040 [Marchantia polymorpha subsp. ruderalis]|uniref:DM10 domain-containing protein n=1 Tax=Marchantia polymorpha subsp. ruderalis TaxID=1480154 RepID=A0A176WD02_MARPO|nr:hypothetical protein AXG93_424s1040 [Marchantia polymorpha subsp. ruderalis]
MDLPAYTFVHPPEQPRKKPQNLNFTDGYPEVRALDYRAAVRGHPPWSTTRLDIYKGYPPSVTPTRTQVKIEYNDTQENYDNSGACDACTDKLGGPQPQWLKFDKRVLRFYAYFKEGIGERRDENMRVRKCTLYYYLSDGTIHIGRFLLKYGYDLGKEEITYPGEPLVDYRKSLQKVITHEIKDYAAKQFLELDGKVFHYFLGDDTVEILEIQERNSGRAPFPMLLRRGRLPKVLPDELLGSKTMMYQKSKEECYKDTDLMIGSYVKVWNRDMLLHDADDFTKAYYKTKYGYTDDMLMPVNVQEPTPILARMEVPPHNGWGTEEDSMMNVIHLMPRSWPKDFFKMMNNGGKILCYACKMAEDANHWVSPVDKTRFFVFQFFLEDDSLSVFEPPARNAGVVNGRYMHRQPSLRKPGTLEAYIPEDFYVGARIELHDRLFDLIKADEWTLKFMEENKDKFPMADFSKVRRKLADQIRQLPEDIKADLTKKIPASNLQCESPGISRPSSPNVAPVDNSKEPVGNLLARAGLKLTQHELITLERNCGRVDSEFEDLQSLLKSMIEAK